MTHDSSRRTAAIEALLARLPTEAAPPESIWAGIEENLGGPGAAAAVLARLPRDIEPPRDLWPGIRARVERETAFRAPHGLWRGVAAAVGGLTIVALIGLTALKVGELPEPGSETGVATIADPGWLAQMDRISAGQPPAVAAPLQGALHTIRNDYTMTRRERLAIEAQLEQELGSAELYALWRHTYEAELALTSEAERILGNLR